MCTWQYRTCTVCRGQHAVQCTMYVMNNVQWQNLVYIVIARKSKCQQRELFIFTWQLALINQYLLGAVCRPNMQVCMVDTYSLGIFLCRPCDQCVITRLQKSHRAWTSCRQDLHTAQWNKTLDLWRFALSDFIFLWFEWRGHIPKLVQLLKRICVVSCLPERPWNVWGHTFCKQNYYVIMYMFFITKLFQKCIRFYWF